MAHFLKFPEDSAIRDFDVFEKFPDGSVVWRACVFGMEKTELKLQELARESTNRFFAVCLQDQDQSIVNRVLRKTLPTVPSSLPASSAN